MCGRGELSTSQPTERGEEGKRGEDEKVEEEKKEEGEEENKDKEEQRSIPIELATSSRCVPLPKVSIIFPDSTTC